MKKITILLIGIVLLIPFQAKALTGSLKMDCIESNEQVSCQLQGIGTDGKVGGVDAIVAVSEELELVSVTTDSSWQGDGSNGKIVVYDTTARENTFNIATIVVKAKNKTPAKGKITISDIIFADENDRDVVVEDLEKEISIEGKSTTSTADNKGEVQQTSSQPENPKTADKNVFILMITALVAIITFVFCYKKYKTVK